MISSDQPTCFPDSLVVRVSSKNDGTMLNRTKYFHAAEAVRNRERFCEKAGVAYENCAYQLIQYAENQTYDTVTSVNTTDTTRNKKQVAGDALWTTQKNVGLFLPVADCVATVMYDSKKHFLALLHLGRHSTYADLATRAAKRFVEHGSDIRDILVWMSPSAGKDSYRLEWFDRENDPSWDGFFTKTDKGFYIDLAGYNRQKFLAGGILPEHIEVSRVDTMTNPDYFSHQAGDVTDRIAVVAMMR